MRRNRESDREQRETFTRRTLVLGGLGAAAFAGLGLRLYQLQVVEAEQYRLLSDDNRFFHQLVPPNRGRILDRYGVEIAGNEQNYQVLLVPEQFIDRSAPRARRAELLNARARALIALLDRNGRVDEPRAKALVEEIRAAAAYKAILVAENVDWDAFARVNTQRHVLPGVIAEVGETRAYGVDPGDGLRRNADAFAHVVGYVSKPNEDAIAQRLEAGRDPQDRQAQSRRLRHPGYRIGRAGIEQTLDDRLQGSWGELRVEVDAVGRVVREIGLDQTAQPGEDLRLTLDAHIQSFAQRRLDGEAGAAAAIDVETGDVICLVSAPAFDPNLFAAGIHPRAYRALVNDERNPLYNKPLAGLYPPGSTFKMITALAGLRAGVNPARKVFCNSEFPLGDRTFHCWKKEGHGAVDMRAAIKRSCDVYFYDLAKTVGIEAIAAEARRFGLGEAFRFAAPGARDGVVPDDAWKRANRGEPWAQGETLNTGIGQGFVLSSPLQLAVMTARLATGKPVRPRMVVGEDPPPRSLDTGLDPAAALADPAHLALVRDAMMGVAEEWGGTAFVALGQKGLDLPGVKMAGKTGTSQVRRITEEERRKGVIKNEDLPWRRRDHALFVCFAPLDAPRYAVALVVEHGGSGSSAASPLARDILREILVRDPRMAALTGKSET